MMILKAFCRQKAGRILLGLCLLAFAATGICADTAGKRTFKSTPTRKYSVENHRFIDVTGVVLAESGFQDGPAASAKFYNPSGMVFDRAGNLYVADANNHVIRKIQVNGTVSTFVGKPGESGSADGPGATARFCIPQGLAIDDQQNVYVADSMNETIRKISPDGVVTTVAGVPRVPGRSDGVATEAKFDYPTGIVVDGKDNLFVTSGDAVRKISVDGMVSTIAGDSTMPASIRKFARGLDGKGDLATFDMPYGIVLDKQDNLYVTDGSNCTVRKITPDGMVTTIAGKARQCGYVDGPGDVARFEVPQGMVIDKSGNLYVVDRNNHVIRKITPAGVVSTYAGIPGYFGIDDGKSAEASFILPEGITMDTQGNVYVSDITSQTIRKISPDGMVTTVAGRNQFTEPGK